MHGEANHKFTTCSTWLIFVSVVFIAYILPGVYVLTVFILYTLYIIYNNCVLSHKYLLIKINDSNFVRKFPIQ